jgi:hypothetical protein
MGNSPPAMAAGPVDRSDVARSLQALDDIDPEEVRAIRDAIVNRAKEGDVSAAKLILDRYYPAPKSRVVQFDLPAIDTVADIPKATGAVLKAMSNGILTPEECTAVASIIEQHRRALELVEVEGRLSRAEEATSDVTLIG